MAFYLPVRVPQIQGVQGVFTFRRQPAPKPHERHRTKPVLPVAAHVTQASRLPVQAGCLRYSFCSRMRPAYRRRGHVGTRRQELRSSLAAAAHVTQASRLPVQARCLRYGVCSRLCPALRAALLHGQSWILSQRPATTGLASMYTLVSAVSCPLRMTRSKHSLCQNCPLRASRRLACLAV